MDFEIEIIFKKTDEFNLKGLLGKLPNKYSVDFKEWRDETCVVIYQDALQNIGLTDSITQFMCDMKDLVDNFCNQPVILRIGIFETNYVSHIVLSNIELLGDIISSVDLTIYPTSDK